jgi:hypothetical protein
MELPTYFCANLPHSGKRDILLVKYYGGGEGLQEQAGARPDLFQAGNDSKAEIASCCGLTHKSDVDVEDDPPLPQDAHRQYHLCKAVLPK